MGWRRVEMRPRLGETDEHNGRLSFYLKTGTFSSGIEKQVCFNRILCSQGGCLCFSQTRKDRMDLNGYGARVQNPESPSQHCPVHFVHFVGHSPTNDLYHPVPVYSEGWLAIPVLVPPWF